MNETTLVVMAKAIIEARKVLAETKNIKCTCSSTAFQYNQGCCCDAGKKEKAAEKHLWKLIEAL